MPSTAMSSSQQTILDFRPQRNSSANSSGSPEAGGAPRQACIGCKRRKVRCDSAKPSCGYCTQRGKECVYPSPYKRAACSQRYAMIEMASGTNLSHVEELERRV